MIFFFRVKLLINQNNSTVAMKIIDLKNFPDALVTVKKEAAVHCRLKHPSIIKYFGQRHSKDYYYIFLEYASGGELFDRIGMFTLASIFWYIFTNRNFFLKIRT